MDEKFCGHPFNVSENLVLGRKTRFIQEVQSVLDEQLSTGHRGKIAKKDVDNNSFHFSIKSFDFTNIKV